MPDMGYRSVEVTITNQTQADLTIQGVTVGSGNSWISGEEAKQGGVLSQFNAVTWGVLTKDPDGGAMGRVNLTGLGQPSVIIAFSNDSSGNKTCVVTPNSKVNQGKDGITWNDSEDNHVQGMLDLVEIKPPKT